MDAEKKQSVVLLLGKKRCRANFTRTPSGTVLRLLMRTLRNLRAAGLTGDFR